MSAGYLIIAVVIIVGFVFVTHRGRRATTIRDPRLGVLNLKRAASGQIVAEDKDALAPVFGNIQDSSVTPPLCEVLFIYCDVAPDGRISGTSLGLREIIRDAGALVVVVASENPGDNYIAASGKRSYGRANLVLTINRRGAIFPSFFSRLFAQMMKGTPMPVAWANLAPQIPGQEHPDCPDAIFIAEVGQVVFK
jgi:hypothetical protein